MAEEIILTSTHRTSAQVKALGLWLNCKVADLHVYIDGVDITKNVVLGEVKVNFEKKA